MFRAVQVLCNCKIVILLAAARAGSRPIPPAVLEDVKVVAEGTDSHCVVWLLPLAELCLDADCPAIGGERYGYAGRLSYLTVLRFCETFIAYGVQTVIWIWRICKKFTHKGKVRCLCVAEVLRCGIICYEDYANNYKKITLHYESFKIRNQR